MFIISKLHSESSPCSTTGTNSISGQCNMYSSDRNDHSDSATGSTVHLFNRWNKLPGITDIWNTCTKWLYSNCAGSRRMFIISKLHSESSPCSTTGTNSISGQCNMCCCYRNDHSDSATGSTVHLFNRWNKLPGITDIWNTCTKWLYSHCAGSRRMFIISKLYSQSSSGSTTGTNSISGGCNMCCCYRHNYSDCTTGSTVHLFNRWNKLPGITDIWNTCTKWLYSNCAGSRRMFIISKLHSESSPCSTTGTNSI